MALPLALAIGAAPDHAADGGSPRTSIPRIA